jgi:hypothetical protein
VSLVTALWKYTYHHYSFRRMVYDSLTLAASFSGIGRPPVISNRLSSRRTFPGDVLGRGIEGSFRAARFFLRAYIQHQEERRRTV